MSFRYSSCFSFSSPNMRSASTSEKPMIALSGVRSSCDMLARNSRLVLAGRLELAALVLDLVEQPRVLDRQGRLGGEGLQELDHLGGELAGRLRSRPDRRASAVFAQQRHGEQRAVAGPDQAIAQARS